MTDYQLYLACNPATRFDVARLRVALGEDTLIQDRVTIEKLAARYHELFGRYLMLQRSGCLLVVGFVVGALVTNLIRSLLT